MNLLCEETKYILLVSKFVCEINPRVDQTSSVVSFTIPEPTQQQQIGGKLCQPVPSPGLHVSIDASQLLLLVETQSPKLRV